MSEPALKKRKVIQRDQTNSQIRWKHLELLGVLSYLTTNFDLWQENHLKACNMAIRETNINRDDKALYNKIYSMIKAMEDYHKEVEKKNEKNQETSNRTSDGDGDGNSDVIMKDKDSTTTTNSYSNFVPQIPFTMEMVEKVYNQQIQNYDRLIEINREIIEKRHKEVRDLYEQISKRQTDLVKLIELANSKLEDLKNVTGGQCGMRSVADTLLCAGIADNLVLKRQRKAPNEKARKQNRNKEEFGNHFKSLKRS
ncbi:hypothetical protein GLOIN_2v1885147 [Rhizophagus clarus]|uniref:Uncharacterized protein n=1 Tax=Rhizophagus clarus TaxID=94130 RepID=A0A8H3L6D3_9GLOM|nr:hypothetical protein GLOIN_2v1885147 [Rhizophagus clarus]